MAISSIFTDFSIKNKKTVKAFVKTLEELDTAQRLDAEIDHTILLDSSAIKKRFVKLKDSGNK
ncbi:MAG: hypothetical protein IKP58_16645 [Victivallales bacterium]|nr:hypothetical protein [Victivallales bacterium]